jgi:glycerate dehydrogenase
LGRGGIVDESELASKIDSSNILVGLDVTSSEPLPETSPLLNIKNRDRLFITPHIAWASVEARERLIAGIVKNIEEFLS